MRVGVLSHDFAALRHLYLDLDDVIKERGLIIYLNEDSMQRSIPYVKELNICYFLKQDCRGNLVHVNITLGMDYLQRCFVPTTKFVSMASSSNIPF